MKKEIAIKTIFSLSVFAAFLFCFIAGCSIAPVLNDIVIISADSVSIRIAKADFSSKGLPAPTVQAYIGLDGKISVSGSKVNGALQGPFDISSVSCLFSNLVGGNKYRIIVVAKNSKVSVKEAVCELKKPLQGTFERTFFKEIPSKKSFASFCSVSQIKDGGYVAAGNFVVYASTLDRPMYGFVVKVNADGQNEWMKIESEDYTYASCVRPTSDGGCSLLEGKNIIVKIDAKGNTAWKKWYSHNNKSGTSCGMSLTCVEPTKDGGYIATGYSGISCTDDISLFMIKIDASGNEEWRKESYPEAVTSDFIKQTSDGGYILFAHGMTDEFIIKVDAKGNKVWQTIVGGIDNENQKMSFCQDIAETADGEYVSAGWGKDPMNSSEKVVVLRLSHKGDMLWKKWIGEGRGSSILLTADSGYITGGGSGLYKLDKDANVIWHKTLTNGLNTFWLATDGGIVGAGQITSKNIQLANIIKMDADGNY